MKEIESLNKVELKNLIDQLEIGIKDMIDSNESFEKVSKTNILIGKCIDLLNK